MNKETMKILRIIVPGIIILIIIYALRYDHSIMIKQIQSINIIKGTWQFILAVIFGAIYYCLHLRNIFFIKPIQEIVNNIKDKLLSPFQNNNLIQNHIIELKSNRTLLHIFYNFIDNDQSLKEKAKNVYYNGLFLSSSADVAILSLLSSPIAIILFLVNKTIYHLYLSIIFTIIFFISRFVILPILKKTHIDLSNEQLEYIDVHFKEELQEKIINRINSL